MDMMVLDANEGKVSEEDIMNLIKCIQGDCNRFNQEKAAKVLGKEKSNSVAQKVAKLLFSNNAYVRNLAIEILTHIGNEGLPAIEELLFHPDRNIRKFGLDVLRGIQTPDSSNLAKKALFDKDENVVQAAIEVVGAHGLRESAPVLRKMFLETNSILILITIINSMAALANQEFFKEFEHLLGQKKVRDFEKKMLVNAFVKELSKVGGVEDLENLMRNILPKYEVEEEDLAFSISEIINASTQEIRDKALALEIENMLKRTSMSEDFSKMLSKTKALLKLSKEFRVDDIRFLYKDFEGSEFVEEKISEMILDSENISAEHVKMFLIEDLGFFKRMGLKLILLRNIKGLRDKVYELCNNEDEELLLEAIKVIVSVEGYDSPDLIARFKDYNEEISAYILENYDFQGKEEDTSALKSSNKEIRRSSLKKLLQRQPSVELSGIMDFVQNCKDETCVEAIDFIYAIDPLIGKEILNHKIATADENLKSGLLEIIDKESEEEVYYEFLGTFINDPSSKVRKKAVKSLCKRVTPKSYQELTTLLKDEEDKMNKYEILANLHLFSSYGDVFELLKRVAFENEAILTIGAIKSLGRMGSKECIAIIKGMLQHEDEDVREASEEELIRLGVME